MKAFVVTGPRRFSVEEVEPPAPAAGQVVVDVERAGVCGTDAEFFSGDMDYLRDGQVSDAHRARVVRVRLRRGRRRRRGLNRPARHG